MLKIKLHSKLIQGEYKRFQDFDELDESLKDVEQTRKAFPDKAALIDRFVASPISDNKYIYWMIRHSDEAPPEEMLSIVDRYDRLVKKDALSDPDLANIAKLKSFEQLKAAVEGNVENKKIVLLSKEEGGGRFEIIRPLNVQTTCHLFGDISKWCIAGALAKNYFKQYSKFGAKFYTLIDHSRVPRKDPGHLFTYVFYRKLPKTHTTNQSPMDLRNALEIYDAVDTKVERLDVAKRIGTTDEHRFFEIMKKEADLDIHSETLEDWRHFLARIKPKIGRLKTDVDSDSHMVSAIEEIQEFYDEWLDEYRGNTSITGDKDKARQNILLFTKNIAKSPNYNFRKKLADELEQGDLTTVPGFDEYISKLKLNPNWREDSAKEFAILSNEDNYDSFSEASIQKTLKDFVENAVDHDLHDNLKELLKIYLKFNSTISIGYSASGPAEDQYKKEFKHSLITKFIRYLVKKDYSNAGGFAAAYFDDKAENDPYYMDDALSLTIDITNVLKNGLKRDNYRSFIAKHAIDRMKEFGSKKDYVRLCNRVVGITNLSSEVSELALQDADDFQYAYSNASVQKYSEKSLEKLIDGLIKERSSNSINPLAFSNKIRYLAVAENLTEGLAKKLLVLMSLYNLSELSRNLSNAWFAKIDANMKRLGIDMDDYIMKTRDRIKKAGTSGQLDTQMESKIFSFNKDHKVFKTV